MKPLHGNAEHWFDECTQLIAERDALAQRCRELEVERDAQNEPAGEDVRGRLVAAYGNGRWLCEYDALVTERDTLRAEAERYKSQVVEEAGKVLSIADELAQLRRWEKEVRENSPLLIRLDEAERQRDNLKAALAEWFDKADWFRQGVAKGKFSAKYLGQHFTDAMRAEIERLQAIVDRQDQQIAALTADPNGWQAGYDKGRQDGTKTRLSELEQERRINRELRDTLRKQRDDYAVGAALQRAAGELPEGFEIRVEVERGAGTVRLYGPEGDEIEGIESDTLADEINEAIDAAMESQACANTDGSSPRT